MISEDQYDRFMQAVDGLKNQPEFMQNFNLFLICKMDPIGIMEPMARILAEYGIVSEKIVPCLMDLTKVLAKNYKKDILDARMEHLIE